VITTLTPQDASFYRLESSSNPIHIGSLAIVGSTDPTPESGEPALDYDRLVDLVEARLSLVPRYRRKVREIPFALGRPVWVEDSAFDITYHVRRSTSSCTTWSRGWLRARSTRAGRCGRCT
jgi:hypothetical protein